ncbi:MAG: hypothetical protein LBT68_03325 [Spirochaetales bacterium]|jgi:hypothetical protein|nr:hypothetical protein [Spirochaetales bacterium]
MNIIPHPYKPLLCISLFFLALAALRAQDGGAEEAEIPAYAEFPGAVIQSFEVHGLERTKLSVIEPYYEPYIGKPYADFSEEILVQELRKMGIFNPEIKVFPREVPGSRETGVDIIIVLEEKWTFLPFPFAAATSGGSAYGGLGLLESNFLGYNKKIYAMGLVSNRGWQGMFGYTDPSLLGSDFGLNLNAGGSISERELVSERDVLWQNYETTDISFRGGLSWKAPGGITAGVTAGYLDRGVSEDFDSNFLPPDSARFAQSGLSFQYADIYYDSVLVYGFFFRAQCEYESSLTANAGSYSQYEANLRHQIEIGDGHRLSFSASGLHSPGAPLVMEREIGGKSVKTLPDGFIADAAAAAQASFEFILSTTSWGAFTAQAAYEAAIFSLDDSSPAYSHGPGAGIRVYLTKIALPAFGIDVYYNIKTGEAYSSVYMGFSF